MKKTIRKELRLSLSDKTALNYLCYMCNKDNEADVLRFCLRFTREAMASYNIGSLDHEIGRFVKELLDNYVVDGKNIQEMEYYF